MNTAVRPKLVLDRARAALDWYADHLGAEIGEVHADLVVRGTHLSVKDADDVDRVQQPGMILEVLLDDPDAVEAALLAGGATSVFPVDDQAYGARAGRVRDPFGVQWLLTTPVS